MSANNRTCVWFGSELIPISYMEYSLTTSKPIRIGDDAMIVNTEYVVGGMPKDKMVRLLKSDRMLKNGHYLVDLKSKEAYPYDFI